MKNVFYLPLLACSIITRPFSHGELGSMYGVIAQTLPSIYATPLLETFVHYRSALIARHRKTRMRKNPHC